MVQSKSKLSKKVGIVKDIIAKPISSATLYGVPLGIGTYIIGASDLSTSISNSFSGNGNLEEVLQNTKLGEGVRDTINRLSSSYLESRFDTFPEIVMDSTVMGGMVLAGTSGLIGYEGYKKFKELRNTKKIDKTTIKRIKDSSITAYHTAMFGIALPLQFRLSHGIANSIEGVDVWNSIVKPAATYITNL